jgi:FMN phosphatase YigB (HAD superfamily)
MIKKFSLCIIVLNSGTAHGICKHAPEPGQIEAIIWDAGSTLTDVSRLNIAQEMGVSTIFSMLWYMGKPYNIQKTLFEVLESYTGKQKTTAAGDLLTYDNNNLPLPQFMSDTWLCSRISNKELMMHINKAVDQWKPDRPVSAKERAVIKKVLVTALSAKILGKHTCCSPAGLELVKACHRRGYKQYILSNFEKEAFEMACKNPKNQELLQYIPRKNILISGECGMIKPYGCIYEHFLTKYNLTPEKCLLVDDRPENVAMARSKGMWAITLESFRKLTKIFKQWKIIR